MLERAAETASVFRRRLDALAAEYDEIVEVRGEGLMWGVELTIPARPLAEEGLRRGVMFNVVQGNVLRFLPPLILTPAQAEAGLDVLEAIMRDTLPETRKAQQEAMATIA